jgi:2-oxoisovalerate dehydrogenase E2 component (dihydrolipoyl transacylase)
MRSSSLQGCTPWKNRTLLKRRSSTTATVTLTPFLLADIGEGIAEVEILEWYVQPGDVIAQFDLICQVQSDKATVDITSRYDGIVDSLHANGAVGSLLRVGQPLLYLKTSSSSVETTVDPMKTTTTTPIETNVKDSSMLSSSHPKSDDADSDSDSDQESDNTKNSTTTAPAPTMPSSSSLSHTTGIQASPAVRKLCRDHTVDLASISPGSGPGGRIVKADVLAHVASRRTMTEPVDDDDAVAAPNPATVFEPPPPPPSKSDQIIPLRGYRRQMFKSMTAALQTPHMCLSDELVMNELLLARQVLNASRSSDDTKVSVLALLCKAISCTLLDFPILNAHCTTMPSSDDGSSDDGEMAIWQRAPHNLGIAMDTSKGLVVPVVRQCQEKSVVDIARELDRLKAIASSTAAFRPEDLTDVTLTISNIGSMGAGLSVHPVLAPPTLAMIALGRIQTVPRFANVVATAASPSVYAASVMTVTYAADHRYIEGATLARFHVRLAEYVQQPLTLLSKLA